MAPESPANPRFVVLAAVDDSASVHEILRVGERFARSVPGGELHLLHVVEDLPPLVSQVPAPSGLGVTRAEILGAGRRYVEKLGGEAADEGGVVPANHLAEGHAAKEILRCAADLRADVVVVGSHGRRGIRRMLLGSVAEAVVRAASCPVVVVRENSYETGRARDGAQPGAT